MNMFDEARAIKGMIEMCSMTQSAIAKKMGVSQSYIANKLRLLCFSEDLERKIIDTGITERHARALLRLKDKEKILRCIDDIKSRNLTVYLTEAMVDNILTDSLPNTISSSVPKDRIASFDKIISLSIENLRSYGINIKKEESFYEKKRYITLCIEEK